MTALPFDGYIRVSRVNGRGGDSYHSPDLQREVIERLAMANGLTVDEVVVEEDVSGATAATDRELGRLIQKIVDGRSGGLIVWKVSRFSRNLLDGVGNAERVRLAGGRIIGSDLDTAAPMGRAILGFLLGYGEEERDLRAAGWAASQAKALGAGKYIGAAPAGYRKDGDGRLCKNGDEDAIRAAFTVRAGGGSWSAVARALEGVGTSRRDGGTWTAMGARTLIQSPLYKGQLGTADGKPVMRPELAIVPPSVWDAAQPAKGAGRGRTTGTGTSLLSGVLKCGGCGRAMRMNRTTHNGKVYAYYKCAPGSPFCKAPASVRADDAEAWIVGWLLSLKDRIAEGGGFVTGRDPVVERLTELELAASEARAELAAFLRVARATDEGYEAAVVERRAAVESADTALIEERGSERRTLTAEEIRDGWDAADIDRRKAILRSAIVRAVVKRGTDPVGARGKIEWSPRYTA